jgi:formylglycine-generating enzyme required for sulfatase activity
MAAVNDAPMFDVSWGDAARFCNWLQNGQPIGAEGNATTETGAYTLNGATSQLALETITRNAGATYFIPSENEWYKAAFYKGGGVNAGYWTYETQSDTAPSNVLSATGTNNANIFVPGAGTSDYYNTLTPVGVFAGCSGPYGTFDMGGDLWQWNEATMAVNARGTRGGSWNNGSDFMASSYRDGYNPAVVGGIIGFRVASVPEPGSIALLVCGAIAVLALWKRRR